MQMACAGCFISGLRTKLVTPQHTAVFKQRDSVIDRGTADMVAYLLQPGAQRVYTEMPVQLPRHFGISRLKIYTPDVQAVWPAWYFSLNLYD